MPNIFPNLHAFTWRGIALPYTSVGFGFSQENQKRAFVFKDQQLVQQLGRSNETFRYSIPLYDGLPGQFALAWTDLYKPLLEACRDRTPGELVDPQVGKVRAVVVSVANTLDPSQSVSGSVFEVEFIEAPEKLKAEPRKPSTLQKRTIAERERKLIARSDLPPDPEFQDPLVDPFLAVAGVIEQVNLQTQKIQNQVQRQIDRVQRIERALSPENWAAREALRDYELALHKQKPRNQSGLKVYQLQHDMTIQAIARTLGVGIEEILSRNPELASYPVVPQGTGVIYKPEAE